MDFKNLLNKLSDILICKHNFTKSTLAGDNYLNYSTDAIKIFLAWIETTPEVRQVLKELDGVG